MTYYRREWTAFTEADLLGAGANNGTSLGHGDTFTMPGSATVTMSTWDNDGTLSGDNYHNENSNDYSGQSAYVDGAQVGNSGAQLYAESYHVLHGSDGKTYYLIEIEVEGYNAPGVGDDYFTFYGHVPPAGVTLSVGQTCNVTGNWVDYRCLGAGDTVPPNTPPHFTNLPSDGIICIDENTSFVIDINAGDADGDALSYEIVGGADSHFFEIDAHTGELKFINAPDFENPQDHGQNNTYDVKVKVSDGNGGHQTKTLWVKVKDVDETDPDCIVIEAEDMHEWGFRTVHGTKASGGELVKLNCADGHGELSTTFNGHDGEYDLTIFAQDECDGQSIIKVKVNGEVVGTVKLDGDSDGWGSDNGHFSKFTLENIQINSGDTVALYVDGDHGEWVRIDKIELCKDGEPCPDGFSLENFNTLAAGTTVADQFDGFTVTAQRDGDAATSENDAMIFDTANPTGGDHDLGFDNQGKAIIISEDNDSNDPDDNAGGGTITFDFDNPSDLHDIKLLDIEGNGTFIELFDENGALIKRIDVVGTGDNTIQTVKLDAVDVARMVITLDTSGAVDDLCFKPGEPPAPGSISGRYFIDDNNNAVDDGEPGVQGVTVELLNADGTGTGITTQTLADGSYSFDNLAPGTYGVKFTDTVSGRTLVAANQGTDDAIDSDAVDLGNGMSQILGISVVSGADTPDNDAGVEDAGTASVGDFVFFDANGNGTQDMGEAGIQGVNVTLTGAGADGVFGTGDDTSETQTTGANGEYLFDGLKAGTYKATFDTVTSAGLVLTTAGATNAAADEGADDSDANTTTGMTSEFELSIGETELDIDAGYVDPATSSIGDKVFLDANGNGLQDMGEAGVDGVDVTLVGAGADGVLGTADDTRETQTTGANGAYLFDGLAAGEYAVEFDIDDALFDFTDQDQGMDEALDSDADVTTGRTGTITLGINEQNLTVDAGVVVANNAPRAFDDEGETCADETITIEVLSNDLDQDDDPLTVTQVGGLSIIEGQPPLSIDGVDSNGNAYTGLSVALVGGALVFDGEAAFAALDIGEEASVTLAYTVDDGFGGTDQANVTVTFCGDANSVDSLVGSLPGSISYQVSDGFAANPVGDFGYDMQIVDAGGDMRLEGVIFESAYCLDFARSVQTGADFTNAPVLTGDLSLFDDTSAASVLEASQNGVNGSALANVNELNWILNQDFENDGTGSVDGTFTGWEVQFAIWELTNGFPSDAALIGTPSIGQIEDVDYIVNRAITEGFDFVAGVGDIVGVVVDPNPATASNDQPFLIGLQFEDYDCIC